MAQISIEELNGFARTPVETVLHAENTFFENIRRVADEVEKRGGIKVILLAGPSGSGKTTSANILKDVFSERGKTCAVVSLDNFYRDHDDPLYPHLPDGRLDMESVGALDTDEIKKCLSDVLAGRRAELPMYDFKTSSRKNGTYGLTLPENGIMIAEGIHALNPVLSEGTDGRGLLKIFVSVSTNITSEGIRLLSGKKLRFIRRLSRDYIYRGASAERTVNMWKSVLDGEDKYLYPFKKFADIKFDTFHVFEPGVLKKYALEALAESDIEKTDPFAALVAHSLHLINDIPPECVPETSLIREFMPGGKYEELY